MSRHARRHRCHQTVAGVQAARRTDARSFRDRARAGRPLGFTPYDVPAQCGLAPRRRSCGASRTLRTASTSTRASTRPRSPPSGSGNEPLIERVFTAAAQDSRRRRCCRPGTVGPPRDPCRPPRWSSRGLVPANRTPSCAPHSRSAFGDDDLRAGAIESRQDVLPFAERIHDIHRLRRCGARGRGKRGSGDARDQRRFAH